MKKNETLSREIVQYYDECEDHYRTFWDLDQSLAMHAGYWDHTTTNLREALARENQILAEKAKISSEDHVLDAGCGVGGSSIYLAYHYGCHVTGITLSPSQTEKAESYARERLGNSQKLVKFYTMDFIQTSFPDASFDVIWGIESICHAPRKLDFIKEAYRLLKRGGRLIIADAFNTKATYTPKEEHAMNLWLKGWGVNSLEKDKAFERDLIQTGFRSVTFTDVTSHVVPSSRRLFLYSYPGLLVSKVRQFFLRGSPLHSANFLSARYQYHTLKKKLWKYGIFYAEKQ